MLRWVSMAEGVCCLGGGGKIWLQLSCVTIFTCLIVCGLRVEWLGGCDMVVGEPYCDKAIHLSACIMGLG